MKRFSNYIGILLALSVILFNVSPASAATPSSSGLSIAPRKNMTINPGQTVSDKLTVTNLNKEADLFLTLKVIDFTYTDESGTPKLFLGENIEQTAWSLKSFVTLPKNVTIPAGQSKSIDYSIKIPEKQGAGSYYSAIQYGTGSSEGGNVSLSASGVSLVFVSVPGIVDEKMSLKKFGAYQPRADGIGGSYLTVATNMPKQMAYTLQNDGNVAESPAASISIKYMFGAKVWNIDNANINSSLALIDQPRLFTTCIVGETKDVVVAGNTTKAKVCKDPGLWPGMYTAKLDVFYGQNGNNTHELGGSATFWYLPWWFIIAASVLLLILIAIIVLIVRRIRRATRRGSSFNRNK